MLFALSCFFKLTKMVTSSLTDFPNLGFGTGLRHCHFSDFLEGPPPEISWVEALTENFLPWPDGEYRRPYSTLEKIRGLLPIALHGVSLSIGSTTPLDENYLKRLKEMCHRLSPAWISDHLCWTGTNGLNLHDLLPLPYSEEAIRHIVDRIDRVQNFLGRRILIENVSSYVEFSTSEMPEWDFLAAIAKRADCGILLDINNIYVSAINHEFDALTYLNRIPRHRIGQVHLAGHTNNGSHLVDTHDTKVSAEVWDLYRHFVRTAPAVSTMVEWDDHIPSLPVLAKEVRKAEIIWKEETLKHAQLKRTAKEISAASHPTFG